MVPTSTAGEFRQETTIHRIAVVTRPLQTIPELFLRYLGALGMSQALTWWLVVPSQNVMVNQ